MDFVGMLFMIFLFLMVVLLLMAFQLFLNQKAIQRMRREIDRSQQDIDELKDVARDILADLRYMAKEQEEISDLTKDEEELKKVWEKTRLKQDYLKLIEEIERG